MTDCTLWNFYDVEPVQDGGFVVVHRHCTISPKPGVLVSQQSNTTFHSYRIERVEAERIAADRNHALGDEHVPYPFNRAGD